MRALALLAVAACARENDVKLLLGPDSDSLSIGFKCVQEADPSRLLFERALEGDRVNFNLVVDVAAFGGGTPGCRGEEIVSECESGNCSVLQRPNGALRFCKPASIPVSIANDDASVRDAIIAALGDELVVDPAPDEPVLFRVVATTQPCEAIQTPAGSSYPVLDADLAVGCAYSCPVKLDEIDRPLTISIDALSRNCEPIVRACAAFPRDTFDFIRPQLGRPRKLRVR